MTEFEKNELFFRDAIVRMTPEINETVKGLQKRDINVQCRILRDAINFKLLYKNGDYKSIVLSKSNCPTKTFEIMVNIQVGNEKYIGSDEGKYSYENWDDQLFFLAMQKCIEDFIKNAHEDIN